MRQLWVLMAAVIAAVIAAVALGACGGEDKLSEEDYRMRAQEVSDAFEKRFTPALQKSRTGGEGQQLEAIDELGSASDEASQELDKLEPPEAYKDAHQKLVDSLTTVGDRGDALQEAAAADDQARIEETRTAFQQSLQDLDTAGTEFDQKVGTK